MRSETIDSLGRRLLSASYLVSLFERDLMVALHLTQQITLEQAKAGVATVQKLKYTLNFFVVLLCRLI